MRAVLSSALFALSPTVLLYSGGSLKDRFNDFNSGTLSPSTGWMLEEEDDASVEPRGRLPVCAPTRRQLQLCANSVRFCDYTVTQLINISEIQLSQ